MIWRNPKTGDFCPIRKLHCQNTTSSPVKKLNVNRSRHFYCLPIYGHNDLFERPHQASKYSTCETKSSQYKDCCLKQQSSIIGSLSSYPRRHCQRFAVNLHYKSVLTPLTARYRRALSCAEFTQFFLTIKSTLLRSFNLLILTSLVKLFNWSKLPLFSQERGLVCR